MGRPCVNHEVCAGTVAPWASLLLCSSGWCGNCRASIGKTAIQPVHSYSDECCPVCQRHGNPLFLFPK